MGSTTFKGHLQGQNLSYGPDFDYTLKLASVCNSSVCTHRLKYLNFNDR